MVNPVSAISLRKDIFFHSFSSTPKRWKRSRSASACFWSGGGVREAAERVTNKVAAALGAEGNKKFQNLPLYVVSRPPEGDSLADPWVES